MSKNRIRLSESQLKNVIAKSVKKMLKEGYDDCDPEEGNCNAPYSEWESFLGGRQPIFEFEDGLTYVDYDENSGCLVSGGVTNNGFHGDGEVEVPVEDGNFQGALEAVYDQLCCMHEPLDESKRRKPAGKKNRVRLSESQLKNVIAKSVKKIISEGGHLTWKDDDGRMHTNSQDNWYGIEGATYVSHGEWSDGEIYFEYQGKQYVINAYDAESWLWSDFKEYCQENNLNPDEHTDDEVWDKFASSEGYEVLLNLGPYNESYEMNENKHRKPAGKKNRVRLSESQLYKVIKEGVKRVLKEAGKDNWETFLSAAKVADQKGDPRSDKFAQYATQKFNKSHGFDKTSDNNGFKEKSTLDYELEPNAYRERYSHSTPGTPKHKAPALNYSTNNRYVYGDNGEVDYGQSTGYSEGFSGDMVDGMPNFTPDFDDNKVRNKNDRQLNNFFSGKTQYKPGKGWRQR